MRIAVFLTVLVAVCVLTSAVDPRFVRPKGGKYNTKAGPKPGILNVHLVSHTHNDPGWLKTVDQYLYGANNSIQHAGVQYILDSVLLSLEANSDRKFIYVEMSFFERWYMEQNDDVKARVRKLVNNGQLEFINGGWVMNDEAAPMYTDIVDQMTYGHRWLMREFGSVARPRIGWHIDPFGHSSAQASLFASMGFDAFYFARIDYDDKKKRLQDITMEMVWRGSASLGAPNDLFTGVTYAGYGPPAGFCFDQFCDDPPIQDDPRLEDYNVQERVDGFVKAALDQASHYKTNHIMMTMGSDFQYENANEWYKNLDKLIHYVNTDGRINVFYSTPSLYTDALHAAGDTWTVKTDDFFPYADGPHAFWSGYFTSRPTIKGYARELNGLLQTCKQMEVLSQGHTKYSSDALKRGNALVMHHDGITGTEKQHVSDDYAKHMSVGADACYALVNEQLTSLSQTQFEAGFQQCPLLNVSICPVTQSNGAFVLVAYNPVMQTRTETIRIPVSSLSATVTDSKNAAVNSQVVKATPISCYDNQAPYVLTFQTVLPAMGYATFFVSNASNDQSVEVDAEPVIPERPEGQDYAIENNVLHVAFDGSTNLIKSITNKQSGISTRVTQNFYWYNASNDGDAQDHQASGAYIFRPNNTHMFAVCQTPTLVRIQTGPVTSEVEQNFCGWVTQVIRLNSGASAVESEFTVGPIPFHDGLGREVVSRWDTDLASQATWYTDSNGRDMMERIRNHRFSWEYNNTEPVAGNFVPVNSAIYLRDGQRQFMILPDRSQAGASLKDGSLELMVHRRLLHDDSRGVGEPLNETGIDGLGLRVRGKHHVFFGTVANSSPLHRAGVQRNLFPVTLAFTPLTGSIQDWIATHAVSYSAASSLLPANVNLMTLEAVDTHSAIIRLEHMYAVEEDPVMSQPARVDLSTLFSAFTPTSCTEMNLSADRPLAEVHRLQWKTESGVSGGMEPARGANEMDVVLNPMQIRTYICQLSFKGSSASPSVLVGPHH